MVAPKLSPVASRVNAREGRNVRGARPDRSGPAQRGQTSHITPPRLPISCLAPLSYVSAGSGSVSVAAREHEEGVEAPRDLGRGLRVAGSDVCRPDCGVGGDHPDGPVRLPERGHGYGHRRRVRGGRGRGPRHDRPGGHGRQPRQRDDRRSGEVDLPVHPDDDGARSLRRQGHRADLGPDRVHPIRSAPHAPHEPALSG